MLEGFIVAAAIVFAILMALGVIALSYTIILICGFVGLGVAIGIFIARGMNRETQAREDRIRREEQERLFRLMQYHHATQMDLYARRESAPLMIESQKNRIERR